MYCTMTQSEGTSERQSGRLPSTRGSVPIARDCVPYKAEADRHRECIRAGLVQYTTAKLICGY